MYHNSFLIVEPTSPSAKYYCGEVFVGLMERSYFENGTTTFALWNVLKNKRHEIKLSSIGFFESIQLDPDDIKEPEDLGGTIKLEGTRTNLKKFWGQVWNDNKNGGVEILKLVQEYNLLTDSQGKVLLRTLEDIKEMTVPESNPEKPRRPLTEETFLGIGG